jgi:hypothetical protein
VDPLWLVLRSPARPPLASSSVAHCKWLNAAATWSSVHLFWLWTVGPSAVVRTTRKSSLGERQQQAAMARPEKQRDKGFGVWNQSVP